MFKVMIGVLIVTIITIFIFLNIDPNNANKTNSSLITDDNYFTVSVSGQIRRPGTYVMNEGDYLYDLLETAGGITDNADPLAFNESITLINSMSYYIAPLYDLDDICGDILINKVGINTAEIEELMTINRIGSSIATAIVNYRVEQGLYQYLEQIMEVSGIGNATFETIKNYITLQ
jgi:competence protein ComEA